MPLVQLLRPATDTLNLGASGGGDSETLPEGGAKHWAGGQEGSQPLSMPQKREACIESHPLVFMSAPIWNREDV